MADHRFDIQRQNVYIWFAKRPGVWIGKHQFPANSIGKSQETWARRARELVELGQLEQRRSGRLAYYRLAETPPVKQLGLEIT